MGFYSKTADGKVTRGVKTNFLNFHAWYSVNAKKEEGNTVENIVEKLDEKTEEKRN